MKCPAWNECLQLAGNLSPSRVSSSKAAAASAYRMTVSSLYRYFDGSAIGTSLMPSVSLPRAKPARPAAVALAEPADEPLEPRVGFQGFLVRLSANQRSP